MRKQKVFNRVSAWLLVWTMVLSALVGNVTVRAEEPEEVDVQIEAETDVQTEVDADMQIEANQAPGDDQNGDDQNGNGQDEDGLPTGLVIYTWLDRNEEDRITGVYNDPVKEEWIGFGSTTWYLVERGEDDNETPVELENLAVQKWNESTEEWSGVTGNDDIYELSSSDEMADNVNNAEAYIEVRFKEIGDYRIYKDQTKEDYITVHAEAPYAGFYKGSKLTFNEYIDGQYEYNIAEEEITIYAIIYEPENSEVQLDGYNDEDIPCGVSVACGDAVEGVDYFVKNPDKKTDDGCYVYTITIADDCLKNFTLNVATQVTYLDEEGNRVEDDSFHYSNRLDLNCPDKGLHILWPWDENGCKEFGDLNQDDACKSTAEDLNERHIYLCTKDEEGNLTQITEGTGIKLSYKEEDEYILITEQNEETYGSIEICTDGEHGHADEEGNVYEGIFLFKPKKEGVYKISDGVSFAIYEVYCPGFGFYKGPKVNAEDYLGYDFNYYAEGDEIRTFYFLKRADIDDTRTIGDVHAVWNEEDKTDIFIQDIKEVNNAKGNGWKITIDPDCQQDFALKVDLIKPEDQEEPQEPEQEEIWLWYNNPEMPHKSGSDGPDKAFSGWMITEWEYRNGLGFWENNCTPDNILYWVHGDSVQEVLDKLAALEDVEVKNEDGESETVSITPTGYYSISMSCYTGNTDEEKNQEKEQIVTLSKDVKGVIMNSSTQEEVAWETEDPDWEKDGSVQVYTGFDGGKMGCYLNFGDDEEYTSGWYEVTQAENGVYVYDGTVLLDVSVPEPGSEEWNNNEETLSAKYQTITKYYNWPNLVLDATTGPASVILYGQWLEDDKTKEKAGVTIKYSNKKAAKFEMTVCGTKITNADAEKETPITLYEKDDEGKDTKTVATTVFFKYVPCDHKGQSGVTKDEKKATCTEAGYTGDTYCVDCDEKTASGTVIPATGHKWDAGKVTKPATETEKGIKTYTCQICKQTKTEDIPLLENKQEQKPKGTKIEDPAGGGTFKVTSDPQAKEPTVEYTAPKKGAKGTVKVPDSVTVDGVNYKVTSIADNAFKGNKNLTKVAVGKNITSIGKNAFSGCAKLKTVTVGSNVTKIGDSAFKGCAALTKITLPAKVEKIGKNAFASCKKLKTIIIKSTKLTAKNISKGAFKGVTTKTTIKVPKSKVKAYKKLFQAKGLSKKVKVKA